MESVGEAAVGDVSATVSGPDVKALGAALETPPEPVSLKVGRNDKAHARSLTLQHSAARLLGILQAA